VSSTDITYASLAKAFDQPLVHHAETLRRMTELIKHGSWVHTQNEEQKRARERMALFPANAELFFVARDLWVVSHYLSALSPMFFSDKIHSISQ
jgi:molybdopterin-biosynthesis enzyme MoeA-like protein